MDIKYNNYYIRHDSVVTHRYNLIEEREFMSGKNKGKTYEDILAYGLTMESAIFRIIAAEMEKQKGVATLKEYLEEYKYQREKVTACLLPVAEV